MNDIKKDYIPFDWSIVEDKTMWLEPCEESYYYAQKWRREGRETLLDLGCGLGRHSVLFAKYGFAVTAADISDDALEYSAEYAKKQNVEITTVKADMENLPFEDDAFDCIFAMQSAGHADNAGMIRIMSEIRRVLKPDGAVFMTLCSKETPSFLEKKLPRLDENTVVKTEGAEQGVPHYFVDKDDIERLFEGFRLVKVRHIDDCYNTSDTYSGGKWKTQKHFFIEAVLMG